ncbi:hypothetical protein [Rhizohabitans arisaemae]|uniref:hypothetical protein n=1 Tax=Rhizohabitans arisaemae TaxID=2720610 RepID=UPI0024B0A928|nr:hypothetical protein [Rhizohabitans arisaemae]
MSGRDPYTYVTASLKKKEMHLEVSFYTPDLVANAWVIEDRRPYLSLRSDEAAVSVSSAGGGPVSARDVTLAREIYNAAARYLADCERLYAEQGSGAPVAVEPDAA